MTAFIVATLAAVHVAAFAGVLWLSKYDAVLVDEEGREIPAGMTKP